MKIPSVIVVAAFALGAAAQLNAETGPIVIQSDAPVATVSYADLNISAPAGRRALETRVALAAKDLCLENERTTVVDSIAQRHCLSFAMTRARADIDLAAARAGAQLESERTIRVAAR
ncbi:MAG TPA: UrcA family protein [Sphingomicrobium sp.]|nr:UrcA family protein [Sphingomicrobium sp.]